MEKRGNQRSRTLKAGKIVFNNKASVIDCTIRNLTDTGALLVVPSLRGIPDTFDLLIDTGKPTRPCRVLWKRQDRLGVKFE